MSSRFGDGLRGIAVLTIWFVGIASTVGSGSSDSAPAPAPTTASTYAIGGTVSGLVGSGLVLQNRSGDNLAVSINGSFAFASAVASGGTYNVTVLAQPTTPTQTCTVTNGVGTITSANIANVSIACTTSTYTIGGTVSGLAGSGLVVQNTSGDNLAVSANGNFVFSTAIASGGTYNVTVLAQPTTPAQTCTVTSGVGTATSANITNVSVVCTTNTYTIGGTVSGLAGSGLTLRNNGGNILAVSVNGSFAFTTAVASGGAYNVTVFTQPITPAQICSVTNGAGTVTGANVVGAVVTCVDLSPVPTQPSLVTTSGRQLLFQRRNPDGTLASPTPYVIRGVTWSPASRTTHTSPNDANNVNVRRPEFGNWYVTDIPLLKAMNVNTVRLFMDPGLPSDANITVAGLAILDELYRNGMMVIMTVDNGNNTQARIQPVVDYYKNHPAILMWSLGSEWNINRFWKEQEFPTVDSAAQAIESAAALVKSLDTVHPVVSSYGNIFIKPNDIERYVTQISHVDVWSFNEYRGPGFSRLFDQWAFISGKPMFLGEFGIDAFNSVSQREDQATHAQWDGQLWDEIARNLSADDPSRVALGGTFFEWNDEFWKTGNADTQDPDGWNPIAFPDGTASEDWWGIVTIERTARQVFSVLATKFAAGYQPPPSTQSITYRAMAHAPTQSTPPIARFWENGALMYEGQGATAADGGGRGFNIAAIDRSTGRLRDPIQRFDTWASRNTGAAMNAMIAYLDNVPDGTLLLIAVGDEAGLNDFDSCTVLAHSWVMSALQRLEALGSTRIRNYCYRYRWAMIAIKGQGVALSEALGTDTAGTDTDASTQVTIILP